MSNVCAILGLRAMYFLLADALERFHLLSKGLAFVLIFVGLKMVWLNDAYDGKFPIVWSLTIIGVLLGGSIVASLLVRPRAGAHRSGEPASVLPSLPSPPTPPSLPPAKS